MESSHLLKKKCPTPKPNLTLEKIKALKELKDDHSWVVLMADKGVALVVMDQEDYMDKAHSLLADTNTYKTITKDPTNKLKINFPKHIGTSKMKEDLMTTATEMCIPPVQLPLSFMAFTK